MIIQEKESRKSAEFNDEDNGRTESQFSGEEEIGFDGEIWSFQRELRQLPREREEMHGVQAEIPKYED